jgi:hypothetical protein
MSSKLLALVCLVVCLHGALHLYTGVDISMYVSVYSVEQYQCLVDKINVSYVIFELYKGLYGMNANFSAQVANARQAGISHIDGYAFICNSCTNKTPSEWVGDIDKMLRDTNTTIGRFWIDVEPCGEGCWSSDLVSNFLYMVQVYETVLKYGYKTGFYSSLGSWR